MDFKLFIDAFELAAEKVSYLLNYQLFSIILFKKSMFAY